MARRNLNSNFVLCCPIAESFTCSADAQGCEGTRLEHALRKVEVLVTQVTMAQNFCETHRKY
jgi:hypothetical protein